MYDSTIVSQQLLRLHLFGVVEVTPEMRTNYPIILRFIFVPHETSCLLDSLSKPVDALGKCALVVDK